MKGIRVVTGFIKQKLIALVLVVVGVGFLGAAGRPFGTDPFSGSREGQGFVLHVVDTDIDEAFEIVDEDSAGAYTYTPISTDTTVMIRYYGSNGDTARVTVTGIRPKRGGNGGTMKDSLSYYSRTYKVDGGDSTATDSVLHMFEQAWVDSGKASMVVVWAKGSSPTTNPLRKIPPRRITTPIAHLQFGSHDTPVLERAIFGVIDSSRTALFDSVRWSQSASGVARNVMRDTLVGDTDADTSRVYRVDGLQAAQAVVTIVVSDGSSAGGNYSLTITPQVSIDSTNWISNGPAYSQTSSAGATTSQILFYTTASATGLGAIQIATKAQLARLDASLYLRWLTAYSVDTYKGGVSDSTFVNIRLGRQYEPSDKGVLYELRQYPNIENALQYPNDYVVRDRVRVPAGEEVVRDYQNATSGGIELPEKCYIAVVARGDDADRSGYVTLIGKRRARR